MELENESRIDELKNQAAEAEADSTGTQAPGSKVKGKKRGPYKTKGKPEKTSRASRAETSEQGQATREPSPEKQAEIAQTAEILKPVFALGSTACVRWAEDERAAMSGQELQTLSTAAAMVIDKHLPSMLDKYGAEVLLFMTVSSYSFRVVSLKRARDAQKAAMARPIAPAPFHPDSQVQVDKEDFPMSN